MIRFRTFRNSDPPLLADLWRSASLGPLAMQPMSTALLETAVFSKPYFDRHGLIVAYNEKQIVGFAHAAFGPNADRSALDHSTGSIVMLVVPPQPDEPAIAAGLIERARGYLHQQGASTVLAGGGPHLGQHDRGRRGLRGRAEEERLRALRRPRVDGRRGLAGVDRREGLARRRGASGS